MNTPTKILFVCNANVGRSQAAEALFNQLTDGRYQASSAGTQVEGDEGQKLKDRPGAAGMLTALREVGIDASENVRTQLQPEMVEQADRIVVLADRASLPEYLAQSPKAIFWTVELPDFSPEASRVARDQIKTLVEVLIRTLD